MNLFRPELFDKRRVGRNLPSEILVVKRMSYLTPRGFKMANTASDLPCLLVECWCRRLQYVGMLVGHVINI